MYMCIIDQAQHNIQLSYIDKHPRAADSCSNYPITIYTLLYSHRKLVLLQFSLFHVRKAGLICLAMALQQRAGRRRRAVTLLGILGVLVTPGWLGFTPTLRLVDTGTTAGRAISALRVCGVGRGAKQWKRCRNRGRLKIWCWARAIWPM